MPCTFRAAERFQNVHGGIEAVLLSGRIHMLIFPDARHRSYHVLRLRSKMSRLCVHALPPFPVGYVESMTLLIRL